MIRSHVFAGVIALLAMAQSASSSASSTEEVERLVGTLTLEEKIDLLGGTGFATRPIERVGIPAFKMSDGPVGARSPAPSTACAAGIGLAASWGPSLAEQIGVQLGRDARSRGAIPAGPGRERLSRSP